MSQAQKPEQEVSECPPVPSFLALAGHGSHKGREFQFMSPKKWPNRVFSEPPSQLLKGSPSHHISWALVLRTIKGDSRVCDTAPGVSTRWVPSGSRGSVCLSCIMTYSWRGCPGTKRVCRDAASQGRLQDPCLARPPNR